jgi:hypothetical protein
MTTTRCPNCFRNEHDSADCSAHVPNGDGTYTLHRQASVYTDSQHRDCEWQRQDHAARLERLRTGNCRG